MPRDPHVIQLSPRPRFHGVLPLEQASVFNSWFLDVPPDEVRTHLVEDPHTGMPRLDKEYEAKLQAKLFEEYGEPTHKDQTKHDPRA